MAGKGRGKRTWALPPRSPRWRGGVACMARPVVRGPRPAPHCPGPVVGPQGLSCASPQARTRAQRGLPGAEQRPRPAAPRSSIRNAHSIHQRSRKRLSQDTYRRNSVRFLEQRRRQAPPGPRRAGSPRRECGRWPGAGGGAARGGAWRTGRGQGRGQARPGPRRAASPRGECRQRPGGGLSWGGALRTGRG